MRKIRGEKKIIGEVMRSERPLGVKRSKEKG